MMGRVRRFITWGAFAAVAACGLTACGTSPRDEYARIRSITVEPELGDGSTMASLTFTPPTALGAADDSLVMTTDAGTLK